MSHTAPNQGQNKIKPAAKKAATIQKPIISLQEKRGAPLARRAPTKRELYRTR